MSVQVTPHPPWVADLDSTLEPSRQAILDTPVIIDASEKPTVDGQIQNFLVGFLPYHSGLPPVVADAAGSLARDGAGVLHGQHPGGAPATTRCGGPWGTASTSTRRRVQEPEPMIPAVKKFHAYLPTCDRNAEFGQAALGDELCGRRGRPENLGKKRCGAREERENRSARSLVARGACQVRR